MTRRGKKSGSSPKSRPNPAFYLDESVPAFVAQTLRQSGFNAELVPAQLRHSTDVAQLIVATRANRILIAIDKDFQSRRFPARRILESAGVVLITTNEPTELHYHQLIGRLLKFLGRRSLTGKLCLVSDAGVRLKPIVE